MKVSVLRGPPARDLSAALERFEAAFRYPLGPDRSFRISHGEDYPRFFRSIGDAACFVAHGDDRVLGVLATAICRLRSPSGDQLQAVYLGDLKLAPEARGGRTLLRLAESAIRWAAKRADRAFCVVMEGTAATPDRYSGRLGLPSLSEIGRVAVLRLSAVDGSAGVRIRQPWRANASTGCACWSRLTVGRYASPGGTPSERSRMEPVWLVAPDGGACGRVEDTLLAKRLFTDGGHELQSAHLSCFAYRSVDDGRGLLDAAFRCAIDSGLPALFAAVPAADADAFREPYDGLEVVLAPATVYGFQMEPGSFWHLNTAEI